MKAIGSQVNLNGAIDRQNKAKKRNAFAQNSSHNVAPNLSAEVLSKTASQSIASTAKVNFKASSKAHTMAHISFTGNPAKNKDQVALVGAEFPPYCQVGGVATVMKDYPSLFGEVDRKPNGRVIIPYYNGKLTYDENGKPTGKVEVLMKDGKPIYTKEDLTEKTVDELTNTFKPDGKPDKTQYWELEEVATKPMEWAGKDKTVTLYKVKDKEHYMVFTDVTAKMTKPYDSVSGGFAYGSSAKATEHSNLGDPYAMFNKAVVETLPDLEKHGFNPAHILCSDAQSAFVPEYMAKKAKAGDAYYAGAKSSYIMHNVGGGYQGETSAQNMFYDFADKKHIETVENSKEYMDALKEGSTEDFFKKFVKNFIDDKDQVNASMIPIFHAKEGYVARIDTVSEGYAAAAVSNPKVANGLTNHLKKLADDKKFGGILNGRSEEDLDPNKPLGHSFYSNECKNIIKDKVSGAETTVVHKPFETFNADMSIDQIIAVKQRNAKNLLERLQEGATNKEAVFGAPGRKGEIMGHIDKKWPEKIGKGEKVNLFVSWGRGDLQKGLDSVMEAFEAHSKTEAGKDSVLVLGGQLADGQAESEKIISMMQRYGSDEKMAGKIVFINGFAPASAMSSAGTASVFPSRFAPCELTDLEAMKFGCTPIVTGIEGLDQKNFDIRNSKEVSKATGYKTDSHFHMKHNDLEEKSDNFKKSYSNMLDVEKKKLELAGVAQDNIESLAHKNVQSSEKYTKLFRKHTDEAVVSELVTAMNAKATEKIEDSEKVVKNSMRAKTNWDNNNALHYPVDKSSKELYREFHVNGASKKAEKTGFNMLESGLTPFKEGLEQTKTIIAGGGNGVSGPEVKQVKEAIETGFNGLRKDMKTLGKLGAIAAGAMAVSFGISSYISSKGKNEYPDKFQKTPEKHDYSKAYKFKS